jgi:hypothetical protein
MYITTCGKCGVEYSWIGDSVPDCPQCGYNATKIARAKWKRCAAAAKNGKLLDVKRLLDDPDVKTNIDAGPWTILHEAVFGDQLHVAECLLKKGANPNISYPQHGNETPLHSAVSRRRNEMAKLLVAFGADADQMNASGKSAIAVARESNDEAMAELLIEEAKRRTEFLKRRIEEKKRLEEENARRCAEQEKQRQAEEANRRAEIERRKPIIAWRKSHHQCVLCGHKLGFVGKLFRLDKHSQCLDFVEPLAATLQCECPCCKATVPLPSDATGRAQYKCSKCHKSFNVEID